MYATAEIPLEEPRADELIEGMAVAFTVASDAARVTVPAYVDSVDEHEGEEDHPRDDYPRRIHLEEYHGGPDGDRRTTHWMIDPLRHRVWCQAPCDDELERAGDLEGFRLDP